MAPYKKDFGTCTSTTNTAGVMTETCALTALQQSLISLTFLFVALGGGIAGLTGNYLGRRGTIQVGCLIVAIGAAGMLGTSGNFTAYVVCKCIGGVGLGHFIAAAPVYGVECVAPSKRGMLTSLFNVGLGFGNAAAAAVCLGTAQYTTRLAWQIPIICQIPLSLVLGVGVMMFPESPRWLLVKGKEDAARKSFARFYNLDLQSPEISRQIREVQYYVELEKATASTTSWTEIFRSTDRRRTLTSLLIVISVAITGGKFVSAYAAVFLAGVGISNTFVINLIVASCALIGSFPAPFIIEYGGRRISLLIGYTFMAVFMLIIAVVGTCLGSQSPVSKNVLVIFLCLWFFVYGSCVGTSISTTAPEMHSVRLRTFGHACVVTCYEIFSFGAAFYTPYMLSAQYGNMGSNVGYFYFGKSIVGNILHTTLLMLYRSYGRSLAYDLLVCSRDGRPIT